uniref:Fibroblast growth factor n=1 Tax=Varanus komodoensis TaxID=61221 RepID=A0A8D2JIY6_VARKO
MKMQPTLLLQGRRKNINSCYISPSCHLGQLPRLMQSWFSLFPSLPSTTSGQSWRPASGRSIRSYPHLRGDVRWRRLYSPNHFFLSIDDNGKVKGTYQRENTNSVVDIRSVHRGTVAIRSIHSGFYVAMNRKGRVYGTKSYSPNCKFKERIEENGYNTYASLHWHHQGRPMFLSLDGRGAPRQGTKTRRQHLSTHFLPLLVT